MFTGAVFLEKVVIRRERKACHNSFSPSSALRNLPHHKAKKGSQIEMVVSAPLLFKNGFLHHKELVGKQEVPWLVISRLKCFSGFIQLIVIKLVSPFPFLFKHECALSHSFVPADGTGTTRVCCRDKDL